MTDNEIIKALEYCADSRDTDKHCLKCSYCNESYCLDKMMADALSLINRQKAEIERLEAEVEKLEFRAEIDKRDYQRKMNESGNAVDVLYQLYDEGVEKIQQLDGKLKTARAEAIKEFAERLKSVVAIHNGDMWSKYEYIDNLVKEMVGDG